MKPLNKSEFHRIHKVWYDGFIRPIVAEADPTKSPLATIIDAGGWTKLASMDNLPVHVNEGEALYALILGSSEGGYVLDDIGQLRELERIAGAAKEGADLFIFPSTLAWTVAIEPFEDFAILMTIEGVDNSDW